MSAAVMALAALMWGAFAALQVALPHHKFDPAWFLADVVMSATFAALSAASIGRRL